MAKKVAESTKNEDVVVSKKGPKAATNGSAKSVTTTKSKTEVKEVKDKGPGEYGVARSKDLPWGPKKVAVFKALKRLKAITVNKAVSADAVVKSAEEAGDTISARDVRHYCYHAAAADLTGCDEQEGVRGYVFYLTTDGAKIDADKELKKQEAEKGSKSKKSKDEDE